MVIESRSRGHVRVHFGEPGSDHVLPKTGAFVSVSSRNCLLSPVLHRHISNVFFVLWNLTCILIASSVNCYIKFGAFSLILEKSASFLALLPSRRTLLASLLHNYRYLALGFTVESFVELKEEEMLADRYHFRGELGRGAFSVVKKAISVKDGRLCAVKVINKAKLLGDPKSQEQVSREIEILKSVRHPNVIGYVDCVDTQHKMYIVLEYADGGELFDHIVKQGAFPEEDAKTIFLQLLQGVAYLHSRGIAHRDLKPENILVHEGLIKITDFGLARLSENKSFMRTLCGTPQYVAPEIIMMASRQDDPNADAAAMPGYTTSVDMWSLGVILYLLLTGRQPFSTDHNRALSLYSQIENVVYNWPVVEDFAPEDAEFFTPVSDSARDLVRKLLQARPADRLNAAGALEHPWLQSAWVYQAESEEMAKAAASSSQQPSVSTSASSPPVGPSSPHLDDSAMDVEEDLPPSSSAKKRQHHSMSDKPPPILPSNSGPIAGRGTMPARVSYKPVNGAASADAPTVPGNAMDTDVGEQSTSSSSAAGGLAYGASAAYIDVNVKRRKLEEK